MRNDVALCSLAIAKKDDTKNGAELHVGLRGNDDDATMSFVYSI